MTSQPRPFLPNGCGAGPTGRVVPDGLGAVEWRGCCNVHDLAYHVGGGLGAKLRADAGLAACMARRWAASARELEAPAWRRAARWLGAATLPAAYFAAVTLLGWTPATWSYRRRPVPTEAELRALEGVSHDELVELARRLEADRLRRRFEGDGGGAWPR